MRGKQDQNNLNKRKKTKPLTTSNPKFCSPEDSKMKHTHLPLQNSASLPPAVVAKKLCLALSVACLLLTNTLQQVLCFITLYLM